MLLDSVRAGHASAATTWPQVMWKEGGTTPASRAPEDLTSAITGLIQVQAEKMRQKMRDTAAGTSAASQPTINELIAISGTPTLPEHIRHGAERMLEQRLGLSTEGS